MTRGRPKDLDAQDKAKCALLDAANECLKEKPYKEISLREVANRAGQNSAMIAYYFGNKEAMFVDLLERGIGKENQKLLKELPEIARQDAEYVLRQLVTQFIRLHKKSPWLSRFIVDNIILKPGKLRKLFVNRVISSNGEKILSLIKIMQEQKKMSGHLDPELSRISLMSLMAFPFIAAPVLKEAFDFDIHEIDTERWIEHTFSILSNGIQTEPAEKHK